MARKSDFRAAGETVSPTFVSYLRVSTDAQGASGLGLEAQREAIERHLRSVGGKAVAEFVEVESGKRDDRPEIAAAISACRTRRATLIIAKLDRLARNVAFISNLMEAGVDFVACDNPHATRLTIHILAAVAEHEREMISTRTKAALTAAKARGVRLGNPRLLAGDRSAAKAAAKAKRTAAAAKAREVAPKIEAARKAGCRTLKDLADALTARGIKTPAGRSIWSAEQVRRIEFHMKRQEPGSTGSRG
jgi:DNA invertase Pin-like site-specific DNA recombinase